MCAFEEEINFKKKQKNNMWLKCYSPAGEVICTIHRGKVLFRHIEWNYGNSIFIAIIFFYIEKSMRSIIIKAINNI
jgi:hypothetical protein